jgi:hypothetical protein
VSSLGFVAFLGVEYYIVADSTEGVVGSFTVEAFCD